MVVGVAGAPRVEGEVSNDLKALRTKPLNLLRNINKHPVGSRNTCLYHKLPLVTTPHVSVTGRHAPHSQTRSLPNVKTNSATDADSIRNSESVLLGNIDSLPLPPSDRGEEAG
ncbi:unnamed protein product [Danaus chrysippus]|uniref:(African queen) hypothetical protein n=1 Tax=Danaus chrysippus TaxID=151541 RepID=A0A8J2R288_9NEOP|nr:unnamed protein product [Danaus chrysippus]